MAFKNEYVPPLEQETSEFLKKAREILRTGHKKNDAWTVDRENNRVLKRTGRGHEVDDNDEEYWTFLDGEDRYSFTTKELNYSIVSEGPPDKVAMTRDIEKFRGGDPYKGLPDAKTLTLIKEAFDAHGAFCMASKDDVCQHTLLFRGEAV
jgi:hypothetical protein